MKNDFKYLLFMFFLVAGFSAFAQNKVVSGKIIDENGESLPGVTVVVEGTTNGTIADVDGGYVLSCSSDVDVLVFSFVGYVDQKASISGKSEVNIQLLPASIDLDEFVAVGYGHLKKSDVTGSVASVDVAKLKGLTISNADQMLKGRLAGVQVTQNSGAPGGAASIRIRGASSINNSNEPLYVIDGIPVSGEGTDIGGFSWAGGTGGQTKTNPLSTISPSDIVSMDVLKDASATAIYGAAGANGVVIITTRRGEAGAAKISYNGYYAVQRVAKTLDMMNLQDYAQYQVELGESIQTPVNEAYLDPTILGEGTDWQDAIYRAAPMQSHQLSLTAGTDKLKFAASAGYMDQEGIIFGSGFKRYNTRMNVDGTVKSWLKMGGSLSFSLTDETITRQDGTDGVILQSLTMQPSVPVYNFDGSWAGPSDVNGASQYNPLWLATMQNNSLVRNRTMGNMYIAIDPIEHLNVRSEFAYDLSNNQNKSFIPTYDFGLISSDLNKMLQREDHSTFWMWKNYATYDIKVQKHGFNLMAGSEVSKSAWESTQLIKQNFSTDDILVMTQDGDFVSNQGSKDEATTYSFFGRLNYNYDDRYLLTGTMRGDASSKFGKDNKWGYFPSAAFAWRASEESFLKDVTFVSNLKLRLGYGMVGNSNIGTYKYGSAMHTMSTPMGTAYRLANVSNPSLKWEASQQYNLGLDFSVLDNRISMVLDVYHKSTKDLLMQVSIPSYLGDEDSYSGIAAPYVNIGETQNKGVELSVNSLNMDKGDFQWSSALMFSINRNEVIALNDDSQMIYGNLDWWSEFQTATAIMVGQPMGVYYGYKVDRLFTDEQDILSSAVQVEDASNPGMNLYNQKTGVYVGDIKFQDRDKDGVSDGVVDDNDQMVIGDPNPDFTFGLNNTFSYKNIELTVGIDGSYGGDILNFSRFRTEAMTSIWDNQATSVANRAKIGTDDSGNAYLLNSTTSMPRPSTNDFNRNTRMSDRWIEDGSYLRISNITLSYSLPKRIVKKLTISNVRVYGTVQNVYTFTNYSGYDPEVGAYNQQALYQNIDMGRYPTARTFTMGINVGF